MEYNCLRHEKYPPLFQNVISLKRNDYNVVSFPFTSLADSVGSVSAVLAIWHTGTHPGGPPHRWAIKKIPKVFTSPSGPAFVFSGPLEVRIRACCVCVRAPWPNTFNLCCILTDSNVTDEMLQNWRCKTIQSDLFYGAIHKLLTYILAFIWWRTSWNVNCRAVLHWDTEVF